MKLSTALYSILSLQVASTAHAVGVRGGTNDSNNNEGRMLSPLKDTCTAAVKVADFGDGIPDTTSLECELPNGNIFKVPVTEAWVKEKLNNGLLISGVTELDTPGASFDEVTGELVLPQGPPGLSNKPNRNRKLAVTTGARTVLAVRVIAADAATTSSTAFISDKVFGTSGDQVNLKSQYEACSRGKITVNPAVRTGITDGVVEVVVPTSVGEGDVAMRNAITNALNAQFGVSSPSQLANHVMYCLPSGTMSGIAYAFVNSWMSVYSNNWCNYPSGQMHEVRSTTYHDLRLWSVLFLTFYIALLAL